MRRVKLEHSVATAVEPSARVMETAAMFGLGVDERRSIRVVPPCEIPLPAGGVVFVTGPSGGGKSTILHLIGRHVEADGARVIRFEALPELGDRPLVDVFKTSLGETTALLAMAGLGDAFVMLRKPSELSDGQRYRLRLAQTIDLAQRESSGVVILADEFAATLDRQTAQVIARNVRRWTSKTAHTFVAATTHDDLLEALEPDVLVSKGLGDQLQVLTRC